MDPLKSLYATIDEIPETFRPLYEERGGQYHIAKIEGIKTDADVARVQRALDAEKTAHGKVKTAYGSFFGDKKPEDVQAMLDRIPELEEIAKTNKFDPAKLDELAEGRVRSKLAPIERQMQNLSAQLAERDQMIAGYKQADITRTIHDHVRAEASKMKVIDSAIDDVLMRAERMFEVDGEGKVITKEAPGVTPGLSPNVWLTEMQQKASHWWPASKGGGAGGGQGFGGGPNPFSHSGWNLTEQGKAYAADPARAKQLAEAAGTTIGGQRPAAPK